MKSSDRYTQCTLKRRDTTQVSWIPTKIARLGNIVKLKEAGEWDEHWEVTQVGSTLTAEALKIEQDQYRNTRKASDI